MSSTRRHSPITQGTAQGGERNPLVQSSRKRAFHVYVEVTELRPGPESAVVPPAAATDDPSTIERISMTPDDRFLLTPAEAARRLSISRALCYRLISSGELPSVVIGARLRRVPVQALGAYLQARVADELTES